METYCMCGEQSEIAVGTIYGGRAMYGGTPRFTRWGYRGTWRAPRMFVNQKVHEAVRHILCRRVDGLRRDG